MVQFVLPLLGRIIKRPHIRKCFRLTIKVLGASQRKVQLGSQVGVSQLGNSISIILRSTG